MEKVTLLSWLLGCIVVVNFSTLTASWLPRENMWEEFADLYNHNTPDPFAGPFAGQAGVSDGLNEFKETPGAYLYAIRISGVRKEDVKVEVEDDHLTIRGESKHSEKSKGESSFAYGNFFKQFQLPQDADSKKIRYTISADLVAVSIPRFHKKNL